MVASFRVYAGLLCGLLALSGCGGGSSSGDSGNVITSGQDPDPVVVDFPIAYVMRDLLLDDNGDLLTSNVRDPVGFFPGAELLLRDRASPSAAEQSLTAGIFPDDEEGNPPLYDVKDLDVSFDGQRLVFAMRAPEDPNLDEDEQPTWNIWLFDRESLTVTRVIDSDITAEDGEDVAPRFLPDGRIVFASTRQRLSNALLLDESKPQFNALDEDRDEEALVLHVMNADGSDIQQITYNQSSDIDPTVLGDGRIAYARWDNVPGRDRISLYATNPDGTASELLYGVHSHDTGPDGQNIEFVEPRELPDGRILVMMRPSGPQALMGALPVAIDTQNFVEHDQPTFESSGLTNDAQEILIPGDLTLDEDRPPLQGRYASIAPLFDGSNRLLTAWSQCRLRDTTSDPADPVIAPCTDEFLNDPNFVEADPQFGVWIFDIDEETQQPIVTADQGEVFSEVVVMEDRIAPPVILDGTAGVDLDADLVAAGVGVLHIRSVYDFAGETLDFDGAPVNLEVLRDPGQTPAADRPARFVRIVKAVSIPDDDIVDLDNSAFGRFPAMREIIGYAPVEPDGSVKVTIPANIAFWIEVLDANGRRIGPRHQNWLHLRPGEEKECRGCHTPVSELPHGRLSAEAPSANEGAPTDGSPFPNTEPALFADAGESMAEVLGRINGVSNPTVDLVFDDVWTDPNVRAKDPSFSYAYADLSTAAPVPAACAGVWTNLCRTVVNFETHIHPLFSVDRAEFDADGALLVDDTCTSCHSNVDADGLAMVPAAQLDLTDGPSDQDADQFKSFRELLFGDNEQEVVNGALIDRLVDTGEFERDEDGNLILDAEGNPIPILVTVPVQPSLNVGGANASPRFFSLFAPGGTHADRLTQAELKLVSEWIDIGGQYYNNPFDVPQ